MMIIINQFGNIRVIFTPPQQIIMKNKEEYRTKETVETAQNSKDGEHCYSPHDLRCFAG